ncbi:MAG: DegT/DnrJ/EryC1/StrS family aminotransferase [Candidatus Zixiibacteriota bacterium]
MHHYLVAPAGTPIVFGELAKTLHDRLKHESHTRSLSAKIRKFTASRYSYFLNSGRAAQTVLLQAMQQISTDGRNEVVLPAYTCYSVAAAAVRAGLKIRLVDVDPTNLDFDMLQLENLDGKSILAVMGCNLFGILNNWDELNRIAKSSGYFLVDDGAQSFGASYKGRASGTLGTAGFYSLGRGKALTTYNGGILVTNHEKLSGKLDALIGSLPSANLLGESIIFAKMIMYSMFIRPQLYWIPASLPFLGLGETIYEENFDISRLSSVQTVAGSVIFESILYFHTMRAANALELAGAVLSLGKFQVPGFSPKNCPPYLRLPVVAADSASRDRAIEELRKEGIVATKMYPSTLRDIPGIESHLASTDDNFPGAKQLVDRLFTLPTHPYLTEQDFDKIVLSLRRI